MEYQRYCLGLRRGVLAYVRLQASKIVWHNASVTARSSEMACPWRTRTYMALTFFHLRWVRGQCRRSQWAVRRQQSAQRQHKSLWCDEPASEAAWTRTRRSRSPTHTVARLVCINTYNTGGATGGEYGTSPLCENIGLVIRQNLHRNSEGGVEGEIVLVIRQYRKSQILVLLSDENAIVVSIVIWNYIYDYSKFIFPEEGRALDSPPNSRVRRSLKASGKSSVSCTATFKPLARSLTYDSQRNWQRLCIHTKSSLVRRTKARSHSLCAVAWTINRTSAFSVYV